MYIRGGNCIWHFNWSFGQSLLKYVDDTVISNNSQNEIFACTHKAVPAFSGI